LFRSIANIPRLATLSVLFPFLAACSAQDPNTSSAPQGDESGAPAESGTGNAANQQPASQNRPTPTPVAGKPASNDNATADDSDDPSDDSNDSSDGSDDSSPGSAGNTGSNVPIDASMQQSTTTSTSAAVPTAVQLRSAGTFAILAQSAITNVPPSAINGDVGISPAAASSITGFPLTNVGDNLTTPEVVGEVFAADLLTPTPGELTTAVADMLTAFSDAAGRSNPDFKELGAGAIGGLTLTPGVYNWTTVVNVASDVTISGGANDVWIFQTSKDLTLAAGKKMILSGGAQAKNIVWQVAGFVELGTTSHAEGIMLSQTAIHLKTGSSIKGRLLAQTAVTLEQSTVTEP
jgi:hypothetical protein